MDAVQFGRWLGERRHACGWSSQRALAASATAREHGAELTEPFLARLEAGHLAFPFCGVVRRRVLALATLLCKTPRDVRGYLRAAGLTELSAGESAWVDRLMRRLAPARAAGPLMLPPRPPRLFGRDGELARLTRALTCGDTGAVAITGMPGAGKSALAAELVHRLAGCEQEYSENFPDGIVWVSAAGLSGAHGLMVLFDAIAAALTPPGEPSATPAPRERETPESAEARLRAAFAGRHMLLVLDDVDAALPLHEALRVLLAYSPKAASDPGERTGQRTVLLTSRYRPAPALLGEHLHLAPLEPAAALALFTDLLGHSLTDGEREAAALLCAALGHLPVAIATAATAAAARGIALPLLAARVSDHPLDALLDGDGALRDLLAHALDPLPANIQRRFALLGALGAPTFGLEPVAAIQTAERAPALGEPSDARDAAVLALVRDALRQGPVDALDDATLTPDLALGRLAAVASDLGYLVRTSLLDAIPLPAVAPRFGGAIAPQAGQTQYHMHPVIAAYALERLEQLDPAVTQAARRSVRDYALAYVERHQSEPRLLERERDLLLAVLTRAWQVEDYDVVVRLVSGLWHLISRIGSYALTARTLAWGITASQQTNDQYHLARFMGRLGSLLYYHGDAGQARRTWESSLEIAGHLRGPSDLWHPLANLAMLACLEGDFARAQRYAEAYLRRAQDDSGGIPAVAGALFKRGLCAHLEGDLDQAYADLSACTRLLALRGAGDKVAHDGIFEMAAQAELARVQGDFARAQHHMGIAVALAEEVCDHYMVADLLLDQARFARLQERQEEARVLARRVVEVATQVEAHQLRLEGLSLLRQLPEVAAAR